jgi:hypothetical protein
MAFRAFFEMQLALALRGDRPRNLGVTLTISEFSHSLRTFLTFVFSPKVVERGERVIWLAPEVVHKLRYLRGPGESYSDVILRFASEAKP